MLLQSEHWHEVQHVVQRRVLGYFRTHGLLDEADAHAMLSWQGSGGFSRRNDPSESEPRSTDSKYIPSRPAYPKRGYLSPRTVPNSGTVRIYVTTSVACSNYAIQLLITQLLITQLLITQLSTRH